MDREKGLQDVLIIAVFFLIIALLFFAPLSFKGVLLTTDDNIGELYQRKAIMPGAFWGAWMDMPLLGSRSLLPLNWTNGLMFLLPVKTFTNWLHAVDLSIGAFFLALFLRENRLKLTACLMGGLVAYWLGTNFTLTYAGHIGKFGILMWAAVFLYCTARFINTQNRRWNLLAGGCIGMMFLEQVDVAILFSMCLGLYMLVSYRLALASWGRAAAAAVWVIGLAVLMSIHPLKEAYVTILNPPGVEDAEAEKTPQEQWNFITQWSWPPEESMAFIAPGYTGWRSGEPEGPYWGRMGRTPGWEQHRQGFRNFKLENTYLGIFPMALAVWAAVRAFKRRKDDPASNEVLIWTGLAILTLWLSFGKFTPLYRLFYSLPFLGSIRNPNKFIQIFQLAVGVLAAYGWHAVVSGCPDETDASETAKEAA